MRIKHPLDELPSSLVCFAVVLDVTVKQGADGLRALFGYALVLAFALLLLRQIDPARSGCAYFLGARSRLSKPNLRIGAIRGAPTFATLRMIADRPGLQDDAVLVRRGDAQL